MPRKKVIPDSTPITSPSPTLSPSIHTIEFDKIGDTANYAKIANSTLFAIQYKPTDNKLQYTRSQIIDLIDNKNIKELRKVSRYFYGRSGIYKRLLYHQAYMLTFDYLVIPAKQTYRKFKDAKFEESFDKTINFVDSLYIKTTFSKISELVFLNGAFFGYLREFNSKNAIQELPVDYCRTRSRVDNGIYQVQFDLRYFDQFRNAEEKIMIFEQFPSEILEMYIEYKEGKYKGTEPHFVDLDPEYAMGFQFDDFGVPYFTGMFEDLVELVDYKLLEKAKTDMDLKKLVVQKLPMNEETGEILLELPDAQALHANLIKMLKNNDHVDAISSPCPIETLNLQDNASKAQRDSLGQAISNVFDSSGFSKSILNAEGNLSLKISVQNDEAISFLLLDMYKQWIDNSIDYHNSGNRYYYEIFFPYITIYNRSEKITEYNLLATYGGSKLIPNIISGIKQSTFINLIHMENEVIGVETLLIPAQSSHTTSGSDVGKPKSDETTLTDSGAKSQNTGSNGGRA